MTVLVLGGTSEARALAQLLVDAGVPVVSSLAGRVQSPRLPVGEVRMGGFGGVSGLAAFLTEGAIDAVVDATHPFAREISANAVAAADLAMTPLLRLARPGWSGRPDAPTWHWVDDHPAAARAASSVGGPVLLTTGRQSLGDFTGPLADRAVVARMVDAPQVEVPAGWRVLRDRGPYTVEGEQALMREHAVAALVTKDSGGSYTEAKLDAAAALGVAVVVVRRPVAVGTGREPVAGADEAARWVSEILGAHG